LAVRNRRLPLFKHKELLLSTAILLASVSPALAQNSNTGDTVDVTTNDTLDVTTDDTVDVTTDDMSGVTTTDSGDDDDDTGK
jgi:hypothetical protein